MITNIEANLHEPDYGTVEWITFKLHRAEADVYDVALFLWRESVALSLSFNATFRRYREMGADIQKSERTLYRRLEALPEYQQQQEHKRLNPSKQARYERRQQEVKNCQTVKTLPAEIEVEAVEVVEPQTEVVEEPWEDYLVWYGEVERCSQTQRKEEDLSEDVADEILTSLAVLASPGVLFIDKDGRPQLSMKLYNRLKIEAETQGISFDTACSNYILNNFFTRDEAAILAGKQSQKEERTIDNLLRKIGGLLKREAFLETALFMPQYFTDEERTQLEKEGKKWIEVNEIDPDESTFLDYIHGRLCKDAENEHLQKKILILREQLADSKKRIKQLDKQENSYFEKLAQEAAEREREYIRSLAKACKESPEYCAERIYNSRFVKGTGETITVDSSENSQPKPKPKADTPTYDNTTGYPVEAFVAVYRKPGITVGFLKQTIEQKSVQQFIGDKWRYDYKKKRFYSVENAS